MAFLRTVNMSFATRVLKLSAGLVLWSLFLTILLHSHHSDLMPSPLRADSLPAQRMLLQTIEKSNINDDGTPPEDENSLDVLESAEVLVDTRNSLSDTELARHVEQHLLPSLPLSYWKKNEKKKLQKSANCSKLPSIFDIEFNNIYWQTMRTSNGTYQLLNAFYDKREAIKQQGPMVRVLGMIDRIEPTLRTYCQLWFEGSKAPAIVNVTGYRYIWNRKWGNYKQGIYQPYLISCAVPKAMRDKVPASVSLVEHECDTASNHLRIIYNPPPSGEGKKRFAVCVKGLDFLYQDLSVRLVEWIELLNILGADKVFMYELQVHPNISKVLRHYEAEGKVHVTPLTLPGGQPNVPGFQHMYLSKKTSHKRQNEVIPYNDCLYKNMYRYDYIALLDTDEVIMPRSPNYTDWFDLVDDLERKARASRPQPYSSFHFRNVYFLDTDKHRHEWQPGVPKYLHMLQHVHRAFNYTKPGSYVKCFHNTKVVESLHNHFPISCLGGCRTFSVPTDLAHMQHYRADCVKGIKSCDEFRENEVEDRSVWKYKDELIARSFRALHSLGFLRKPTPATTSTTTTTTTVAPMQ